MRHIGRPALSTQHLIFNLFGDYLAAPGQAVATAGLLEVLSLLGVGERATRSTLSRMKRRGWLEPRRIGRCSSYRPTPKARRLPQEGSRRPFGRRPGAPGIPAPPRTQEVQRLLRELEVDPYVHIFAGARLDPAEQDRVVDRCWN